MLSRFSRVQLFVNSWTVSPPGSFVHGIFQARMLEWDACPPPGDLLIQGSIEPMSPASLVLAGRFFTTSATWEAH